MKALSVLKSLYFKGKFKAQAHAPEILMVVGAVELGLTIYSTVKAAYKFRDILDEHNKTLEEIKELQILSATGQLDRKYTDEDAKNERRATYMRTAVEAAKCWGWVGVNALGTVGCFSWATGIEKQRYFNLQHAYAGVIAENQALKALKRVDDAAPEGEEQTETSVPSTFSPSTYSKIFDSCNPNFEKSAEANHTFLNCKRAYLQNLLEWRGYLFLNEVYEALGFEKTQAGQIMGWAHYKTPEEARAHGSSNFVDFGLDNLENYRFNQGIEYAVMLNFNVDSLPILDRIGFERS